MAIKKLLAAMVSGVGSTSVSWGGCYCVRTVAEGMPDRIVRNAFRLTQYLYTRDSGLATACRPASRGPFVPKCA